MLYALLAYHVEADVASWTPEDDAAVMTDLHRVHDRLDQKGHLGPAARLGWTKTARTLRGPGAGLVIDGPFAEIKDALRRKPRSKRRATCAASILQRCTRSAPSPSISPESLSRERRLRPTIRPHSRAGIALPAEQVGGPAERVARNGKRCY